MFIGFPKALEIIDLPTKLKDSHVFIGLSKGQVRRVIYQAGLDAEDYRIFYLQEA